LARILRYGERSGAREFLALVPTENDIQALLLGHGFKPLTPVYLFTIPAAEARELGASLTRLLPGIEGTEDLLIRRGQADVDRIDRVTRNINRESDHIFWLKELELRAGLVRQGERIAAYGYGGSGQVGPIAGSTQDAALSGLGWALELAAGAGGADPLEIRVPAPFGAAIDALLDADARLTATLLLFGKDLSLAFDRLIFGPVCLP